MLGELRQLWTRLSARQRASIIVAVAALLAGLYGLVYWHTERDFTPLFENLAEEEAGQIVARLKESGVEVRLADGGRRVLVPSANVAEQRLALAAQGLPRTGRIGFELFDQTNFGATDFTEQVNYQRAIEGELERSLMTIQEIERARVHITFAKNSVFLENQQPAKGSVMVKLKQGMRLDARQVSAVSHLVASAVEGLTPEEVSVVDMRGNLLSRPKDRRGTDGDGPPGTLLEFRKRIEDDLQAKLVATLDPLLGPGRYRASVMAELDMTSGDESSELFDPDQSVMASTQKQEDVSTSARGSGVPGTTSNLPRGPSAARAAGGGVVRRSETVAFQTSRTVRHRKLPQGILKRVSVAILLDQQVRWEGTGPGAQRVLEAPSQQTLDAIRELVTGAVGLTEERGDQLVVESLPFEQTLREPPPEVPGEAPPGGQPDTQDLLRYLGEDVPLWVKIAVPAGLIFGVAILALLLARRRRARRIRLAAQAELRGGSIHSLAEGIDGGDSLEAGESGQDLQSLVQRQQELMKEKESAAMASLKQTKMAKTQMEVLTQHLVDTIDADPNGSAQIVRSWLTEERRK